MAMPSFLTSRFLTRKKNKEDRFKSQFIWLCCLTVKSCPTLLRPLVHQASLPLQFPRQEYWRGLPFPSQRDLPNLVIEPMSFSLLVDFFFNHWATREDWFTWHHALLKVTLYATWESLLSWAFQSCHSQEIGMIWNVAPFTS